MNENHLSLHARNILFLEEELPKYSTKRLELDNPKITYFKSGGGNHLYLVISNGQKFIARVNYYSLKNEWGVKKHEFEVLEMLKPLNIAPKAYIYSDDSNNKISQHWNLIEFIEGENPTSINDDMVVQLAKKFALLHKNWQFDRPGDKIPPDGNLPYKPYLFNELSEGEDKQIQNFSKYTDINITLYSETQTQLGYWFNGLAKFKTIRQFSWIHNDTKPENIIVNSLGQVFLIDWEYSYCDIPENDLAKFITLNNLNKTQKQLFLKAYGLEIDLKILNASLIVYDFFKIAGDYLWENKKTWDAQKFEQELIMFKERNYNIFNRSS